MRTHSCLEESCICHPAPSTASIFASITFANAHHGLIAASSRDGADMTSDNIAAVLGSSAHSACHHLLNPKSEESLPALPIPITKQNGLNLWSHAAPAKEAQPKKEAAPKEAKPKAAAAQPTPATPPQDDTPKPAPKPKDPLAELPPSKMLMDSWKRLYSNTPASKFNEICINGLWNGADVPNSPTNEVPARIIACFRYCKFQIIITSHSWVHLCLVSRIYCTGTEQSKKQPLSVASSTILQHNSLASVSLLFSYLNNLICRPDAAGVPTALLGPSR